jgi:hypothetical protein
MAEELPRFLDVVDEAALAGQEAFVLQPAPGTPALGPALSLLSFGSALPWLRARPAVIACRRLRP